MSRAAWWCALALLAVAGGMTLASWGLGVLLSLLEPVIPRRRWTWTPPRVLGDELEVDQVAELEAARPVVVTDDHLIHLIRNPHTEEL